MTRRELLTALLCTCAKFISVQVQKKNSEKHAFLVPPTLHSLRRLSGPISPPVSLSQDRLVRDSGRVRSGEEDQPSQRFVGHGQHRGPTGSHSQD